MPLEPYRIAIHPDDRNAGGSLPDLLTEIANIPMSSEDEDDEPDPELAAADVLKNGINFDRGDLLQELQEFLDSDIESDGVEEEFDDDGFPIDKDMDEAPTEKPDSDGNREESGADTTFLKANGDGDESDTGSIKSGTSSLVIGAKRKVHTGIRHVPRKRSRTSSPEQVPPGPVEDIPTSTNPAEDSDDESRLNKRQKRVVMDKASAASTPTPPASDMSSVEMTGEAQKQKNDVTIIPTATDTTATTITEKSEAEHVESDNEFDEELFAAALLEIEG